MCFNFLVVLFCALTFSTFAQLNLSDSSHLRSYVYALTSDTMKGRGTGTEGELRAIDFVLKSLDSRSKKKFLTYSFKVDSLTKVKSTLLTAFVNNHADSTLLVTAHIDHLGYGGEYSKSLGKHAIHPGADDNASGVAMLMVLHNYFAAQQAPYNYLFVALTGHEVGLYGAKYLSMHWQKKWRKLVGMLNMDMIGRMDAPNPTLYLSSNLNMEPNCLSDHFSINQDEGARCAMLDTKFFLQVPCRTFTTGMHSDYHKISDKPEYLNYQGLQWQVEYYKCMLTAW